MADRLEDIIGKVVRERFTEAEIDSIEVEADRDSDGDPILRVTVVLDTNVEKLKSRELAGLARHVRPELAKQNQEGFPIFRFLSKSESERSKRAAA